MNRKPYVTGSRENDGAIPVMWHISVTNCMSHKLYESRTICHGVLRDRWWNACDVAYVNHELYESLHESRTIWIVNYVSRGPERSIVGYLWCGICQSLYESQTVWVTNYMPRGPGRTMVECLWCGICQSRPVRVTNCMSHELYESWTTCHVVPRKWLCDACGVTHVSYELYESQTRYRYVGLDSFSAYSVIWYPNGSRRCEW